MLIGSSAVFQKGKQLML